MLETELEEEGSTPDVGHPQLSATGGNGRAGGVRRGRKRRQRPRRLQDGSRAPGRIESWDQEREGDRLANDSPKHTTIIIELARNSRQTPRIWDDAFLLGSVLGEIAGNLKAQRQLVFSYA